MVRIFLTATGVLLIAAHPLAADVTPVGVFTGQRSENLEAISNDFLIDPAIDIFDGGATVVQPEGHNSIHLWNGSAFNGDTATPRSGRFLIGATRNFRIDFETSVSEFGAYWSNTSGEDDATATFYSRSGTVIAAHALDIPGPDDTGWHWNGWTSDVPIARIEIVGNGTLNGFIWMDDLTMTQIPTPATPLLAVLAAATAARRRPTRTP